jgi:hypothetical protein
MQLDKTKERISEIEHTTRNPKSNPTTIYKAKKARTAPRTAPMGAMLRAEAAPVNWAGFEGRIAPVPVAVPIGTVAMVDGMG